MVKARSEYKTVRKGKYEYDKKKQKLSLMINSIRIYVYKNIMSPTDVNQALKH